MEKYHFDYRVKKNPKTNYSICNPGSIEKLPKYGRKHKYNPKCKTGIPEKKPDIKYKKPGNIKKKKYFDAQCRNLNLNDILHYKSTVIDDESNLILPGVSSKKKTQVMTKKNLNPFNYSKDWESHTLNNSATPSYTNCNLGCHWGPGKGFGNLDVNNDIRTSEATRLQNDNFKRHKEAEITTRFEFIKDNYQDPKHVILPFPRGGYITRNDKKSKEELEDEKFNENNKKFEFKY